MAGGRKTPEQKCRGSDMGLRGEDSGLGTGGMGGMGLGGEKILKASVGFSVLMAEVGAQSGC